MAWHEALKISPLLMVNCYHCLTGKTEVTKDETLKSHDDCFRTGQKPRLAEGTDCLT